MEKGELQKRLDAIVCQIKANSKDAHFANKLIDEALSLKGQLDIEPTMVHIPVDSVLDSIEGETFTMYVTNTGTAVYHTFGGYTVIAEPNNRVLNGTIRALIDMVKNAPEDNDELKENYDTILDASCRVLNVPFVAFCDDDFMLSVARLYGEKLNEIYDKRTKEELQPETPKEDAEHKEAMMALAQMNEEVTPVKKTRKAKAKNDGKSKEEK